MTYEGLLDIASTENIEVTETSLPGNLEGIYFNKHIRINRDMSTTIEKACILAEELGHYYTTTGDITDQDIVGNRKQELNARFWSYNKQIGLIRLVQAFDNRCKNRHEMAEYLNVTEEFLSDALACYKSKYGVSVKIDNYIICFEPCLQIVKLL
jgi:hypothetical protein